MSKAAVLARQDGRGTGTESGTFSPSLWREKERKRRKETDGEEEEGEIKGDIQNGSISTFRDD